MKPLVIHQESGLMPPFGPIQRAALIRCFKALGFAGPHSGGNQQFMLKGELRVRVPNPHRGDIGKELLGRVLRQVGISRDEWEEI